jgi:hypothetical protein
LIVVAPLTVSAVIAPPVNDALSVGTVVDDQLLPRFQELVVPAQMAFTEAAFIVPRQPLRSGIAHQTFRSRPHPQRALATEKAVIALRCHPFLDLCHTLSSELFSALITVLTAFIGPRADP